ncbi:uncharacterized protein LOC131289434 isoform X2 [Anopheles ziemanni]|uniref:uncharacterized protein LOC131261101 isoform X2 n=1 Tax=Anopheles coustani TaxID=139045 RepID=UPI002659EA66|nr:uncharacterized protein LOC131261101 isoform X2 [Anopheles coustani]XP_058174675.1 uncharacterized protein LOC131289434 isoform X2 [Anopheles ziemanni]
MSDQDDPLSAACQQQQQQQQQQQLPVQTTPRSSLGSGALSYSNSSISPSTSSSSSQGSAKSAVSECLGAWLNYLQIMNNLCAAGYRLAQTIAALEPWAYFDQPSGTGGQAGTGSTTGVNVSGAAGTGGPQAQPPPQSQQIPQLPFVTSQIPSHMAFQFITAWDELARASVMATSTVKSHIVSVLQDFKTQPLATVEQESELLHIKEYNQLILQDNAQTMINLQHQFCVASCDAFAQLMCCYQCQTQVGFPHDPDCPMMQHPMSAAATIARTGGGGGGVEQRSQTPSPHFGLKMQENARLYDRTGSISTQGSSSDHGTTAYEQTRGPSPHDIRGPSPIQGYLDNIRGPLPNPGHLSGMKAPFYRGSRSPLNFPLFTLNGQRRWSEAAAGEVNSEAALDPESQMRRWSMPWEAKADKTTVHWNQTRLMPISKLAVPATSAGSGPAAKSSLGDRSQSTTPDSTWHSSITSQDGLVEAIQLLSCRPIHRLQPMMMMPPPNIGPPFVEEPSGVQQESQPHSMANQTGLYGIWTQQNPPSTILRQSTATIQDRMGPTPLMNYIREQDSSIDESPPNN